MIERRFLSLDVVSVVIFSVNRNKKKLFVHLWVYQLFNCQTDLIWTLAKFGMHVNSKNISNNKKKFRSWCECVCVDMKILWLVRVCTISDTLVSRCTKYEHLSYHTDCLTTFCLALIYLFFFSFLCLSCTLCCQLSCCLCWWFISQLFFFASFSYWLVISCQKQCKFSF